MLEPEKEKQIQIQPPAYSDIEGLEGPDYGLLTEDEGGITEVESSEEDSEDTEEDTEVEDESEDEITPEDFDLPSYDEVKTELVNKKNKKKYLSNTIGKAINERNKLNGFKSNNTKRFKAGEITATETKKISDQLDNSRVFLTAYINHNKELLKTFQQKGSGIPRKQEGGNMIFFLIM